MSSFVLITKSETSKNEKLSSDSAISVSIEMENAISLKYHSEAATRMVSLKLDSLLQRINKRHDFHGSILVAKNKKIVYNNQIGYADFGKKKSLTQSSAYQLASVSKQFTAAAIMLLHERNQIKITDTVNKYFPNFPFENGTIKNL